MANYEELEPRFKQSLLDWMETKNPFWSLLGMEVLEMKINYLKPFTGGGRSSPKQELFIRAR